MTRNPELFPDPDAFRPERYMQTVDQETAYRRDPRNVVFGFGRRCVDDSHCLLESRVLTLRCRRCPGSHLIESSLWIVIASILATFDVKKAVDGKGKMVEPTIVFENAVFRYVNHPSSPLPFFNGPP